MTKKKDGWDFLLNLDEGELREALSQSRHLKNIMGSPAKIKELLCVLQGLAEDREREGRALFSKAQEEGTTRRSISISTKITCSQNVLKRESNDALSPQGRAQAKVISLDFGINTDTHFFGLYAAGRPDLLLYIPLAEKQPSKTEIPVLDLTEAGYLTKTLWSVGRFDLEHVEKDPRGQPLLLSVEDQGLFLNGQFHSFKKTFPEKTLVHFSQLYVCDKVLRPLVHDGVQFLYRGDPRRDSTLLNLTRE